MLVNHVWLVSSGQFRLETKCRLHWRTTAVAEHHAPLAQHIKNWKSVAPEGGTIEGDSVLEHETLMRPLQEAPSARASALSAMGSAQNPPEASCAASIKNWKSVAPRGGTSEGNPNLEQLHVWHRNGQTKLQNLNVHVCNVCVTMQLINKINPSCGAANWFSMFHK